MKKVLIILIVISFSILSIFLNFNSSYTFRLKSYLPVETYIPDSLKIILEEDSKAYIKAYKKQMRGHESLYPKANYSNAFMINKGDTLKVQLRPKGDWVSHLKRANFSFRIKQKKGNPFFHKNRKLSFHDPSERNFIFEYVFHQFLENEGVLNLDYDFVFVRLNDNKYCYAVEDAIGSSYLKKNKLQGPIYKFDETAIFNKIQSKTLINNKDLDLYHEAKVLVRGAKFKEDSTHFLNKREVLGIPLDSFNINQVAKYIAICDLFGGAHALRWHNLKMVKRNGLLEFIGSDANPIYYLTLSYDNELPMIKEFFKSKAFVKLYKKHLRKYMDEDYVVCFLNEKSAKIKGRIKLLQEYYPKSDNNLAFLFANIDGFLNR